MSSSFFKIIPKSFLGIDIGTSSVKIVELSAWGERIKLENYGELSALAFFEKQFRTFEKNTLSLSNHEIAKAISAILIEAKIKEKKSIFSIPDFCTFFTTFDLPPMTNQEIPLAVKYQARQYIPLSLSSVTLDWQIIEGKPLNNKEKKPIKILVAAVPNETIEQYQEITKNCNLQLHSLEAEVFSLVRALIKEDKRTISIIDIGAQSTTCNIIEKKILKFSHSFDLAGNELTQAIAKSLNIDYKEAEDLKKRYGILPSEEKNIAQILQPIIDMIILEIEKIFYNFSQTEKKEIQKIILAGGTAFLPGLKEYFLEKFKVEIEIANPFLNIFYPPILDNTLKEMGPTYAVAVGAALRGLE